MSLIRLIFGRRLASDEEEKEQLGVISAIPVLGLDALASAAYGPEAALTVLLPLGALGVRYIVPISLLVIALLAIVAFSYRQTIDAYPSGGGSYTVAKDNLGTSAGLVAAAALLLDYMLNVAVAISAGVGALVSAVPSLLPHTLMLCLAVLALLTVVNLRGARSSGIAFSAPTFAFVGCLFTVLAIGVWQVVAHGGHPPPVISPAPQPALPAVVSLGLLCRAFANGCAAMTGVEAVSNGITAFRNPSNVHARRTLTVIVAILMILLAGIALLSAAYGIGATQPGHQGYESVLSQLIGAVVGRGAFYYVSITAVVAVLALSANTSFADFPRLCRILATDRFLPEPFLYRGRRLAFSYGIGVLTVLSAILLVVFGGVTERLIPLFAVGAFLSFTMSQAGMVGHWRRVGGRNASRHLAINACGAVATALTLLVVIGSKLAHGAWISVVLIIAAFFTFSRVHRYYRLLGDRTRCLEPLDLSSMDPPLVVVPIRRWDIVAQKGLRFALNLSDDIYALQVLTGDPYTEEIDTDVWNELVEEPVRQRGLKPPRLVVIRSRYRRLFKPLIRFVTALSHNHPGRQVAVVVPEVIELRWYHSLLHNHTASILKALLTLYGKTGIIIISTPWYLDDRPEAP